MEHCSRVSPLFAPGVPHNSDYWLGLIGPTSMLWIECRQLIFAWVLLIFMAIISCSHLKLLSLKMSMNMMTFKFWNSETINLSWAGGDCLWHSSLSAKLCLNIQCFVQGILLMRHHTHRMFINWLTTLYKIKMCRN